MNFENCNFGRKYNDACFSKLDLPDWATNIVYEWVKNKKGILTFLGTPGVGKTYTCACAVKEIDKWNHEIYLRNKKPCAKNAPNVKEYPISLYYYNAKDLIDVVHEKINSGGDLKYEFVKWRKADYFIINDLGKEKASDYSNSIFFDIIDQRNADEKPTLITSNLFLKDLGERFGRDGKALLSRLSEFPNFVIELSDFDKRQKNN